VKGVSARDGAVTLCWSGHGRSAAPGRHWLDIRRDGCPSGPAITVHARASVAVYDSSLARSSSPNMYR
jgi:hypothetical protein